MGKNTIIDIISPTQTGLLKCSGFRKAFQEIKNVTALTLGNFNTD
jgi:hypothetical protein